MTEYSEDFTGVVVAFEPEIIYDNLSKVISDAGMKQYHVTETTKYAHVTFFFNGGIEEPNKEEKRALVDSVNVKNFAEFPEMRREKLQKMQLKQ